MDGMEPRSLQATVDQRIQGRLKDMRADEVMAGSMLTCSEGAHVFSAEVTVAETRQLDAPEDVFGFKIGYPKNYLAGNFLVKA
jgi:hypothetical protein